MPELTIYTGSRRRLQWDGVVEPEEAPAPSPVAEEVKVEPEPTTPEPVQTAVAVQTVTKVVFKPKNGNGHKIAKQRDLLPEERSAMRAKLFMPKNGQIAEDDCVAFRQSYLNSIVGIFQVTGFISYLHHQVARGEITLSDLASYEQWMRAKYNDTLWARYNLPIYVKVRQENQALVAKGLKPTAKLQKEDEVQVMLKPKFVPFSKYKKWSS